MKMKSLIYSTHNDSSLKVPVNPANITSVEECNQTVIQAKTGSNSKAKNAPANPPKQLKKEKTQLQPQPLIEDGNKALSETSRVAKLVLKSSVPPNKLDPPITPRWPLEVLRTRVLLHSRSWYSVCSVH
ncbi:hypothetical protein QJS04_geneDACA023113 [Acorus gramineus]|uniref:Uncharacterized protein n=1 Tax=Acorus gramineus TaxID=55184 RepID=A0AAV9A0L8_ACOGR|nr:hypothetical protein QJS04_geneDACA023113 [Acorus gramineus]